MGALPGLSKADIMGVLTAVADGVRVDWSWLEGLAATPLGVSELEALTSILSICGGFRRRTVSPVSSFNQGKDRRQWPKSPHRPAKSPRS
jgi:hypothetical protein